MTITRYRSYSDHLFQRYGKRVFRLGIDPGFPCPIRAGGPCAYCLESESRASYLADAVSVTDQVAQAREFVTRRYKAQAFILYVQARTPTNTSPDLFRDMLDEALAAASVCEIVVATRPDCFDDRWAHMLAGYSAPDRVVGVELGLQSANDNTLRRVNRGHGRAAFESAFAAARSAGLEVGVHVILGLPGEGAAECAATADYLAALRPDAVKLHNLVIVEGTELYKQHKQGLVTPPSGDEYVALAAEFIARMPRNTVVVRMTCDPPRHRHHLPSDFPAKAQVPRLVEAELARRGLRQGDLCGAEPPTYGQAARLPARSAAIMYTPPMTYHDLPALMTRLTGDEKHSASSTSTLEVLWVLYDRILNVAPDRLDDPARDRFLLSKGHGPMAYYAVLAAKGFLPPDELDGFAGFDSRLGQHPDGTLVPGVEIGSGSLGHGLPMAVGLCLGLRLRFAGEEKLPWVFCLLGDAELEEGSNHEAIAYAGRLGLGGLTAVVVDNHSSSLGWPGGIGRRFEVEGWRATTVDGRDHGELEHALAHRSETEPHVVVADIPAAEAPPAHSTNGGRSTDGSATNRFGTDERSANGSATNGGGTNGAGGHATAAGGNNA